MNNLPAIRANTLPVPCGPVTAVYPRRRPRGRFLVTGRAHPFREDTFERSYEFGTTLGQILDDLKFPSVAGGVYVWLGGVPIDPDMLDRIRPLPGSTVNLRAVPGGGNIVGLDTIRIFATILAEFGALAIGTIVGGPMGVVLQAGLGLLGALLVNALIPPPRTELPAIGYNVSGYRNEIAKYRVVPVVFGRFKCYPPMMEPYSVIDERGNESIHLLLIVGHGPLSITDVRAGDTPISEIAGAQLVIHEGNDATDPALSIYPSDVDQDPVNVELTLDGYVDDDTAIPNNWVTRTTEVGTDRISVDLVFPDGIGRQDNGGGGLKGWRTGLQIQYRPVGFYTWRNMAPNLASLLTETAEELYDADGAYPDLGQWADLEALTELLEEQIAELETAFGTLEDVEATQEQRDRLIQELGEILDRVVEMGEAPPTYTDAQGNVITIVTPFVAIVTNTWGIISNQWGLGDTSPSQIIDRIYFVAQQILALIDINRYTTQGNGPALESFPLLWRFIVNRRGLGPIFGDPIEGAFVVADKRLTPIRRSVAWPVMPGQYEVRARRVSLGTRGIFNDYRQALTPSTMINLDSVAGGIHDGVDRIATFDIESADRDRVYFQIGGSYVVSGVNTLTVTLKVEHAANNDFSDAVTLFISTNIYNNIVEPIVKLGYGDAIDNFNRYIRVTATLTFSAASVDSFDGALQRFETGNTTDEDIFEKPWWAAMRSIRRYVLPVTVPNVAKLEIRLPVGPQVNNVVNQINCIATAKLPVWDGVDPDQPYDEWPVIETRNPAWAYAAALCKHGPNQRAIAASRLHLDELKEWADDCAAEEINFHGTNIPAFSTVIGEDDPENGTPVYGAAVDRFLFSPGENDSVRATVDVRLGLTAGQTGTVVVIIERDDNSGFTTPETVVESDPLELTAGETDEIFNRRIEVTGNSTLSQYLRLGVTVTMSEDSGDGSATVVAVLKIGRFDGRTFDAYIAEPSTVFQMMRDIAGTGRAAFSLVDARYSIIQDKPQEVPVQMFTPRNSSGFTIRRNLQPRPEGIKVRFNDPDHDYQIAEIIVPADGFDAAGITGPVPNAVDVINLLGCTQAEQAYADGRYYLAVFELRRESYSITCDWEYLIARRGKLCLLAGDIGLWGQAWPRLLAVQGNPVVAVELDNPAIFSTAAAPYLTGAPFPVALEIVNGDANDGTPILSVEQGPVDTREIYTVITEASYELEAGESVAIQTRILTDTDVGFGSPAVAADTEFTITGPANVTTPRSVAWADVETDQLDPYVKVEITMTFSGTGTGAITFKTYSDQSNDRYGIRFRTDDGTFQYSEVYHEAGDRRRLRLKTPITADNLPKAGDLVTFGVFGRETFEVILKEVRPLDNLSASLTFVPHAPEVHLPASEPQPDFDPRISTPPVANQSAPPTPIFRDFPSGHPRAGQDMIISDEAALILLPDGSFQPRILAALERPVSAPGQKVAAYFEAQIRPNVTDDENPWDALPFIPVEQTEIVFVDVLEGLTYDLRFRTVSNDGRASAWLTVNNHLVTGKTNPPPDVTALFFENGNTLRWNYETPIDFAGFIVRYAFDPATSWANAIGLHEGLIPVNSFAPVPGGTTIMMVKAVDTSGNQSANEGRLTVTRNLSTGGNVVEEISASAGGTWPYAGSPLAGMLFVNQLGQLEADQRIRMDVDVTTFRAQRIRGDMDVTAFRASRIADYNPWFSGLLLDAFNGEDVPYTPSTLTHEIDLEQGEAVVAYSVDSGDNITTIPPSYDIQRADIEYLFALVMTGQRRPVLNDCVLIYDVEDVDEIIEDAIIAPGGTRLTLTEAYSRIKVVSGAVKTGGTGISYIVADYQADPGPAGGPLIHIVDGTGASIGGTGSFEVKGY